MDIQNRLPASFLMNYRCTLLFLALVLAGCSASTDAEPTADLPVLKGCFVTDTRTINVSLELVATPQERRKGLMGRESLGASSGMLFEYQQSQSPDHGFWMYQTLIPLDIAYLDEKGSIGSIRQMVPCTSRDGSRCPSYPSGVAFISAVEMNAGFFEANGIGLGDTLKLEKQDCKPR
ncbi:DUF192 domain-containing protein [Marinobacter sp. 1_MG-2023]|uniref:DUF192 domain-containing protein n=1 Tax=Marinobacter sp. 1_MG-2023 TaxID=3062627 RepID=UPI0026E2ED59|nr:DUF192 domain-containing protein [Marinobacter sp. 1_MG-2023]MDO6824417.1 DUF192 domain-containing protein [Marinobacter sp. 1_MG-2023]